MEGYVRPDADPRASGLAHQPDPGAAAVGVSHRRPADAGDVHTRRLGRRQPVPRQSHRCLLREANLLGANLRQAMMGGVDLTDCTGMVDDPSLPKV